MTHSTKQLVQAGTLLLAGLGSYLWWHAEADIPPTPVADAHVGERHAGTATVTTPEPAQADAPSPRVAVATVDPEVLAEAQRAAWKDRAETIQMELMTALLSGNAEAIASARAKASALAGASAR